MARSELEWMLLPFNPQMRSRVQGWYNVQGQWSWNEFKSTASDAVRFMFVLTEEIPDHKFRRCPVSYLVSQQMWTTTFQLARLEVGGRAESVRDWYSGRERGRRNSTGDGLGAPCGLK